jgi:HEAT repeat protein
MLLLLALIRSRTEPIFSIHNMPTRQNWAKQLPKLGALVCFVVALSAAIRAQDSSRALTPLQLEIEKQRQNLGSTEIEKRRDAVMHLGLLRRAEASRAALPALSDADPMVRATAASAVIALPGDEAAAALIPLLSDKDEFVRQQVAYALGSTRSRSAVAPLVERLTLDKMDAVRAAAAVSLGQIGDESAVVPLASTLSGTPAGGKAKKEKNEFILRTAARSLGQMRSRAGVPALIEALNNQALPIDVRRESARSLGLIGDAAALPALRNVLTHEDIYLAQMASEAIRLINFKVQG